MAKYTYDEVKNIFEQHGMILVSDEYHNRDEKLDCICDKHPQRGIQKMSLVGLQQGQKCVYCRYENGEPCNFILPEDIYQEETEKAGYNYVGFHKEKSFVYIGFICPKHEYKGTQSSIWNSIKNGKCCCSSCNGNDRSTEDFQAMVHEKLPQIDVIGNYLGAKKRVDVRCAVCGNEWSPFAYNLLSGYGCQDCYDNRRGELHHVDDSKKRDKLEQMHPDIEFLSIPYYARDNVKCRCKECGNEWYASYTNLTKKTRATGCPQCSVSKGESKIMQLLDNWGIQYEIQKEYEDLCDINALRFDFKLPKYNLLIEYDGEYHYYPIVKKKTAAGIEEAESVYENTIKHDKMKNDYCKNKGITLIRIPYWEYKNLDEYLYNVLKECHILK